MMCAWLLRVPLIWHSKTIMGSGDLAPAAINVGGSLCTGETQGLFGQVNWKTITCELDDFLFTL